MDDPRASGRPEARQRTMTDDLIEHRAARVSWGGVDDHACGLVNRDDMLIFVENGQGEGLRFEGLFLDIVGKFDGDEIVGAEAQPRPRHLAVELHRPGSNELLQARARQRRLAQACKEPTVEPSPRFVLRDLKDPTHTSLRVP
jgi:hypothetical protein